MAFISLFSA